MDLIQTVRYFVERAELIALPFTLCVTAVFLFQNFAQKMGVMDKPSIRKLHEGSVPMIGGIAIYLAFSISMIVFSLSANTLFLLGFSFILLVLGYIDDVFDISPLIRIVVQALVAGSMAIFAGNQIEQLGNLFGAGPVVLSSSVALLFTIVCTIGVINAVNMIDGVDGLAISILAVSFAAIALVAWMGEELNTSKTIVILLSASGAFMLFNARLIIDKALIFLGDSGSVFLGFTLCWFFIALSQGEEAVLSPVAAGWIFGVPLLDTITVMVRRIVSRKSPFSADREHLHHRLIDHGYSVNQTVRYMVFLHFIFVLMGVIVSVRPETEFGMFWLFVSLVITHYVATPLVLKNDHEFKEDNVL